MAIDEIVGDSIDRAVNIEMRFRAPACRAASPYPLYEAARKKQKKPLTWLAAKLLKDSIGEARRPCIRRHRRRHAARPAGRRNRRPARRRRDRARRSRSGSAPSRS